MIDETRAKFQISDEEALCIKQVTEEKTADTGIRKTVHTRREDRVFLGGPYRGQVNGEIQTACDKRGTLRGVGRSPMWWKAWLSGTGGASSR